MKRVISFFDSGIGGLTTLAETVSILPNADFCYFAATDSAPLGSKSCEEILAVCERCINLPCFKDSAFTVFACNTATNAAADRLRQGGRVIVGAEPAVKPAVAIGRTAALVTPRTAECGKFHRLLQSCGGDVTVLAPDYLASEIEKNFDDPFGICDRLLARWDLSEFDAVVLGCTHFVFLKDALKVRLPHAAILDGNRGIAENAARKAAAMNIAGGGGSVSFLNDRETAKVYAEIFTRLIKETGGRAARIILPKR